MLHKYLFTASFGFAGCEYSEEYEYDEKPTEKQLQDDWWEWASQYIEGNYEKLGDKNE